MLVLIALACTIISTVIFMIFVAVHYKWTLNIYSKHQIMNITDDPIKTKLDKQINIILYGRKILRKVIAISHQGISEEKKRMFLIKCSRRLLQMRKDTMPLRLNVLEYPAEYLEEESIKKDDVHNSPDAYYMLQSIRIFGLFSKAIFTELCRHTETINVPAGFYLFKMGDPDENVFVVKSGSVSLNITLVDGSTIPLKLVKSGDSIASLLSITDVLTGHTKPYRTISARAVEDSTVVRLPVAAFQEVLKDYPDSLIQIIQVTMVRLQRVTFAALYQYLGLSTEIPQNENIGNNFESLVSYTNNTSNQEIDLTRDNNYDDTIENSNEEYLKRGTHIFMKELELNDDQLISGKVEIHNIPTNSDLMNENVFMETALVLLLDGSITVFRKIDPEGLTQAQICTINPGNIIGGLAVLTEEIGFLSFKTSSPSVIAILSKDTIYELMRENQKIILPIANTVIALLPPFVRQVDFALEWLFIESGRAVYRQGDESDGIFIVLSGRLRSVITQDNMKKELVAEYGKGDLVGIVEVGTETPRSTTLIAVRDSELAKLPKGLFNAIKIRFPVVGSTVYNLLGRTILGTWKKSTVSKTVDTRPSQSNFSNIAIVPILEDVPLTSFTYELYHSLCAIGSTLRLTSDYVRNVLGSAIMEHSNEYRLTTWLAYQEDHHKIVLYQCDDTFSPWTQRCIRQADCILLVTLGDRRPTIGKYEKEIERLALRTQKELVLLRKENASLPTNTVAWLDIRSWVSSHHHIRCSLDLFSRCSVLNYEGKCAQSPKVNIHSDFSRLARWLTGTSIGLVLGGGGARGSAHMGMIKAIQEAGIPIDMVGGVSIGAFMGAIFSSEKDVLQMIRKARLWAKTMTYWWRHIMDVTYPVTSVFTGQYFNSTLISTFGDTQIEDLWLPYFTVTADITASEMRIHTHGSLWRYVRSSMSQSWYLPPLCDPIDGHLLLDGGYINNLPADVMRSLGAKYILAIDVGSQDNMDFTNYKDSLQGFWLLWRKINPFAITVKVPSIADIQSRLAYVSCVRQLEVVKNSDYCQYIRPPIDKYKTLQFADFEEIKEVGYKHGKKYFEDLESAGIIPFGN
ncbi:neuropathy target esterase sws-like [Adelges cooleyi]|uniref:neuropathy target esterase sws-like n=1 Tax=Adelges cooleyi TaxID=133065 RepID=UPI00217FFECF|nr:neuropathy target esterase sws-like [Adelges cooleyi]